jgi:hypothetical protein
MVATTVVLHLDDRTRECDLDHGLDFVKVGHGRRIAVVDRSAPLTVRWRR